MAETREARDTDRTVWEDYADGSYYLPRILVTEGGGIGIDVGGYVIVKTLREWHALAERAER